jgi:AcrR family transcriptional regulator
MGRPRGKAADHATVERLLAAAEEEFGRVGFRAARLEDIAERAQIRRPSLLYHFNSKEELHAAVVKRAFVKLAEILASAMSYEGPFPERLDRLVERYLAFLEENPALVGVILRDIIDGSGPGQEILLTEVAPLLGELERFVEAAEEVPKNFPTREAVLQIATSSLMRAAAGRLREPLWGTEDHTRALVRALFHYKE